MMINYMSSLMPFEEFRQNMKKVVFLHQKSPSWSTTMVRTLAVLFIFCMYPWILLFEFIWNRIARRLIPFYPKRNRRPIPGSPGLQMMGETLSYQLNKEEFVRSRCHLYGPIFQTKLDFSGTYLWAEDAIFCLDDSISTKVQPVGTLLGYCGFFGYNSEIPLDKVAMVAEILFNDSHRLDQWENLINPIIQQFLYRLSFEQEFSFADKVNELACELTSTLLLGMTGYSARLQNLLDNYLLRGQLDENINKSDFYREHMKAFIQSAIREEDRVSVSSFPWHIAAGLDSSGSSTVDNKQGTLLGKMLVEISSALRTDHVTNMSRRSHDTIDTVGDAFISDQQVVDFIFVLIADVFYRSLVQHLRSLLFVLLTNKRDLMMVSITALEAYHNLAVELASNRDLLPQIQGIGLGMGPDAGGVQTGGQCSGFRWSPFLRNDPEPFTRFAEDHSDGYVEHRRDGGNEVPLTSPLERVIHAAWHLMGNNDSKTGKGRGLLNRTNPNKRSSERMRGRTQYRGGGAADEQGRMSSAWDTAEGVEEEEEQEEDELEEERDDEMSEEDEQGLEDNEVPAQLQDFEVSEDGEREDQVLASDEDTVDRQRGYRNQFPVLPPVSPGQERLQIRTAQSNESPSQHSPVQIREKEESGKHRSSFMISSGAGSHGEDMMATPYYRYEPVHHQDKFDASMTTPRRHSESSMKHSEMPSSDTKPASISKDYIPPRRQDMSNKQRERLNIASKAYCRSIEDIAECAEKAAILPKIPMQHSFYRIHSYSTIEVTSAVNPAHADLISASSVAVFSTDASSLHSTDTSTPSTDGQTLHPDANPSRPHVSSARYDLHPGDLLCMVNHLPDAKETASAEQYLHLGLLGRLILMSFTHDLLANYRWKFERNFLKISSQLKASPSFTSICNAAFTVSGFRKRVFSSGSGVDSAAHREEKKNLFHHRDDNIGKADCLGNRMSTVDGYVSDGL